MLPGSEVLEERIKRESLLFLGMAHLKGKEFFSTHSNSTLREDVYTWDKV